ncbi:MULTISPECIES: hypothetical protein [Photorhabdus]|uniref:DUF4143 domain-containing protein n=1 Tax=Photorhabdus asymbiotica subsp. asymbiotica (strain ATCC 43949 / 3105-77) TaxID=553480 RepID=C7BU40_PHOAA|nr:hypothetical protein [Photorhabdus asymbiotica]CAQ82190.1 conserved hypothetical protein [Photorhabdus asymbiotica]
MICQSGWSEHELYFSHYRDKDQIEVDLVIEDGRRIWGEVKKTASIPPKDGMGLARLASLVDRDWQSGILLYTGNNCLPISHIPNTICSTNECALGLIS